MEQKDAGNTVNLICNQLKNDNLPLADCRSHCYDNAALISGYKSGVQKRVIEMNGKVLFVNCDDSLNLAGVHSTEEDQILTTFFGTVDQMYTYFFVQCSNGISSSRLQDLA